MVGWLWLSSYLYLLNLFAELSDHQRNSRILDIWNFVGVLAFECSSALTTLLQTTLWKKSCTKGTDFPHRITHNWIRDREKPAGSPYYQRAVTSWIPNRQQQVLLILLCLWGRDRREKKRKPYHRGCRFSAQECDFVLVEKRTARAKYSSHHGNPASAVHGPSPHHRQQSATVPARHLSGKHCNCRLAWSG